MDEWVAELQQLNTRLRDSYSEVRLGTREQRRQVLRDFVGPIKPLRRLAGPELGTVLAGMPLVGVDGSVNTFGGEFPHYMDLFRAMAKSSDGQAVVLKGMHCPMHLEGVEDDETALREDYEVRQRKLAHLEVQAALGAIDRIRPKMILMDGPLVRFDMRTRDSFSVLRRSVISQNIQLVGCIENIESRVISTVLGDAAPPGWHNAYDRDLLWGTLDYGEVLQVSRPAKGTPRKDGEEGEAAPIRTWFMRSAYDPGVVGVEMLEEQVADMPSLIDYLFTLSPADGRGIPIWLDLVDREVRLTKVELEAYLELLDPQLRRFFVSKRDARFF